jgi:uncharacterized protein YtpQ (UPF0354 family)
MFGWFKKRAPALPVLDRSMLVPRIKNLNFSAALKEMQIPEDQLPYTEPLVADLLVSYAFDLPHTFEMASLASMAELGIRQDEARAIAIDNLKRQLPDIGFTEQGPLVQVVTGRNLEACTLLAGRTWDEIAAEAEGEVVAAVPSRDVVLFCRSNSEAAVAALRALAAEVFSGETTHALTKRLLAWRDHRWVDFDDG